MAIALTLMRQRNAVSAQRAVTDTTNDLLTQNASMLKQNAIETATENERGIVDIETLKATQSDIIETIEQTLQIQQDGRQNVKLLKRTEWSRTRFKATLVIYEKRINIKMALTRSRNKVHPMKLDLSPTFGCTSKILLPL